MKHAKHHAGFTLLELIISIGIFVMIFVSMTQIFFLMQTTIARINAQREMVAWLTIMTQTVATDLENYAVDVKKSDASTLALKHVSREKNKDEEVHVIYRTTPVTVGGESGYSLVREVQKGTQQPTRQIFNSPLFFFSDITLRVTPDSSQSEAYRCSVLPAVTMRLAVKGNPTEKALKNMDPTVLQTSFSSNDNPASYRTECKT